MRRREIIQRESGGFDPKLMPYPVTLEELRLEVLLDIRELLATPNEKVVEKVVYRTSGYEHPNHRGTCSSICAPS